MIKLGLIGSKISHSRSPEILSEFISEKFEYDLIDIDYPENLPSFEELKNKYHGLNITAPYKKAYADRVNVSDNLVKKLGVINTLRFDSDSVFATNTDLLALREIIRRDHLDKKAFHILGSGSMAQVVSTVLGELDLSFKIYSRSSSNLGLFVENTQDYFKSENDLIINCCSRDFVFTPENKVFAHFWDMNYSFSEHSAHLPHHVLSYQDGLELLRLQAKHAVGFWNL